MKFTSENPSSRYESFSFNGLRIFLDKSDFNNQSGQKAIEFCMLHGYTFNENKATALFYLRGHLNKTDSEQVLVGILEVEILPRELSEIIHCLSFWNQDGVKCYNLNKNNGETYTEFILRCIASDCKVFAEPYCERYLTRQSENHVWVQDRKTNQRILIIHF